MLKNMLALLKSIMHLTIIAKNINETSEVVDKLTFNSPIMVNQIKCIKKSVGNDT